MEGEVSLRVDVHIDTAFDQESKPGVTGREIVQNVSFTLSWHLEDGYGDSISVPFFDSYQK